ncbi:hypothetical protein BJX63DRAFT_318440 [Aspergillus granulosus]|uniref:Transmembrane protein n=1 Tax=Aspergillus granulosus TaxID=176169 RepID=A0ABR4H4W9_9EURO
MMLNKAVAPGADPQNAPPGKSFRLLAFPRGQFATSTDPDASAFLLRGKGGLTDSYFGHRRGPRKKKSPQSLQQMMALHVHPPSAPPLGDKSNRQCRHSQAADWRTASSSRAACTPLAFCRFALGSLVLAVFTFVSDYQAFRLVSTRPASPGARRAAVRRLVVDGSQCVGDRYDDLLEPARPGHRPVWAFPGPLLPITARSLPFLFGEGKGGRTTLEALEGWENFPRLRSFF